MSQKPCDSHVSHLAKYYSFLLFLPRASRSRSLKVVVLVVLVLVVVVVLETLYKTFLFSIVVVSTS